MKITKEKLRQLIKEELAKQKVEADVARFPNARIW